MITLDCSDHITSQNFSLQLCNCHKGAIHFQVCGGSPKSYASWTAVANSLSSNLPTHSASHSTNSTTGLDHFFNVMQIFSYVACEKLQLSRELESEWNSDQTCLCKCSPSNPHRRRRTPQKFCLSRWKKCQPNRWTHFSLTHWRPPTHRFNIGA